MEPQLIAAGSLWPVFQGHIFRFQLHFADVGEAEAELGSLLQLCPGSWGCHSSSLGTMCSVSIIWRPIKSVKTLGKGLWCCTGKINTCRAVRILACCSELCSLLVLALSSLLFIIVGYWQDVVAASSVLLDCVISRGHWVLSLISPTSSIQVLFIPI